MSRHRRLQKTLRSPIRQGKVRRNRRNRIQRRCFREEMMAAFAEDMHRQQFINNWLIGMHINRPQNLILVSGV